MLDLISPWRHGIDLLQAVSIIKPIHNFIIQKFSKIFNQSPSSDSKIDNKNVATFSKKIITDVIRKKIGFKGIIISDDISMKALKFDLVTNAKKSLAAGCNIVLYCGGKYEDSYKLIKEVPYIDKFTSKKTSEFYKFLR